MKGAAAISKYKLISLLLIAVAAIALATSGTIAFFTDFRESTGVFTAGSVYIELTEAAVKIDADGNLIEDSSRDRVQGAEVGNGHTPVIQDYGVVFPGQTIHKDPTVKNVGSEDAWVAVKVIIEDGTGDINKLFTYGNGTDDIDIERLLSGGLLDESAHVGTWCGYSGVCYNDNYAMLQYSSHRDGRYEFFFLMLKPMASGETVEVFDTFFIDPYFGNEEMQEFRELKITVQAFAVQEYGFSSCLEAVCEAFPERFDPLIKD